MASAENTTIYLSWQQLEKELCKVLEERYGGTEQLLEKLFPQRRDREISELRSPVTQQQDREISLLQSQVMQLQADKAQVEHQKACQKEHFESLVMAQSQRIQDLEILYNSLLEVVRIREAVSPF